MPRPWMVLRSSNAGMQVEGARAPETLSASWQAGELPLLVASLIGGAILRGWLSVRAATVEPWSDMRSYLELAALMRGPHPPLAGDRPLLYPWLLARAMDLGLAPGLPLYLGQSLLSLAVAALLARLAARWFGRPSGYATFALGCFSITWAQYSALALTETVFAFLFFSGANLVLAPPRWDQALGVRWARRIASMSRIIGVLAFALASAMRPAGLALSAGLLALCPGVSLNPRAIARVTAMLLLLGISYLGIVTGLERASGIRTGLFPTSGVNLYLGNSAHARWDGGSPAELPSELAAIRDPVERGAVAKALAIEQMRRHPLSTLAHMGTRVLRLAGINPGRVEFDALTHCGAPAPIVVGWLAAEWIGLCLLASIGFAYGPREASRAVVASLAPYLLTVLVAFVQTRYRLPVHLWLLPFAGAALARWATSGSLAFLARRRRAIAITLGLLLAGMAFDLLTRRS